MDISIIRVVQDFYPSTGGSITDTVEIIEHIQPLINSQIIIAPKYQLDYSDLDNRFVVPVRRVNFNIFPWASKISLPILCFINLFYYSHNVCKQILELIKETESPIIFIHGFQLGLFILILSKFYKFNYPIIIMHHSSPIPSKFPNIREKIVVKINLFLLNFVKPSYYLQVDDGTRDDSFLQEIEKREIKYKIVYHAIDTDFYKPSEMEHNGFNILSNHRLVPYKSVDLAILAFREFLGKISRCDVKMKIMGGGPLLDNLKELVSVNKLNNRIEFLGELNVVEAMKQINESDVIVGTSLISNLNRSILEAMSCEKAVILFDNGSKNDLFINMYNSLIVEQGNLVEFAEKMKLLADNDQLRIAIGKNARESILKTRSWRSRPEQELEVYREVLRE